MRALSLAASFLLLMAMSPRTHAQSRPPDLSPGVSESLALERASRVSDVRYSLAFDIPSGRTEAIPARAAISFALSDASAPLALDFEPNAIGRVRQISVAGVTVNAMLQNGHLILPASALRAGTNIVVVDFEAGDAPLNRNDDFLYTIFVPARAHEAFPCFDQPDLKARWTLALDVPAGWQALGNGAETRAQHVERPHARQLRGNRADFDVSLRVCGRHVLGRASRAQRPHVPHVPSRNRRARRSRATATRSSICTPPRWTGSSTTPASRTRSASSISCSCPAFQFGGMEHPGAIFYNATGLMLDESATQNQLLGRASVDRARDVAHVVRRPGDDALVLRTCG